MFFKKIYVAGNGSTAAMCAKLVKEHLGNVVFLNSNHHGSPFANAIIEKQTLPSKKINRQNIHEVLNDRARTLVLSVNNMLIFPPEIVRKPNLTILNYHNSLLPVHRGVHAECWTIFDGDPEAGVTWHKVDEGIDTGPVLWQRKIPVSQEDTSLRLLKKQSACALALLEENIEQIASGQLTFKPQIPSATPPHFARNFPWECLLDQHAPEDKIWNFLRALDYGKTPGYPRPLIGLDSELYSWDSYQRLNPHKNIPENIFKIPNANIGLKGLYKLNAQTA